MMHDLSQVAASILVSSVWETMLLTLGIACGLRLLPALASAHRYRVWCLGLLMSALLPLVVLLGTGPGAATGMPAHTLALDHRWGIAIAAIWLAFSLVRAGQLVVSGVQLRRLARMATPVEGYPTCRLAGTRRTAVLCTSAAVNRPSVVGFFAPRILIPAWLYPTLTQQELVQIVLHEMQHLRRNDDWMNLLQKVSLVLFPLNPALLWVERQLCLERELACDDSVLEMTKAPRSYASCLVNLAERQMARSRLSLALGAWEQRSELAQRVHAILRGRRPAMSQWAANVGVGVLALMMCGGGLVLSRSPQLISFRDGAQASELARATQTSPAVETGAFVPVVFHPDEAAGASMVRTSLPVVRKTRARGRRQRQVSVHRAAVHEEIGDQLQPVGRVPTAWLQLTTYPSDAGAPDGVAPRVIVTVLKGTGSSSHPYAVVPTVQGWLFLEL